ncbi:MAG: sensor histidine kinase [Opitutaceae bacterium]|nr:sensor histidine kinase [Opitutaceae bacterium]
MREGTLLAPDQSPLAGLVVERVAQVGPGRAILSTSARDLLRLDHGVVTRLPGVPWEKIGGRIAALEPIPGGAVAMAVVGVGLYIIASDGEVVAFFSETEYRDIKSLASNEPGVLWAATESGLVKILLGLPVTRFNQASGLPVFWPQFLDWRGRLWAVSNGHLYESVDVAPGLPARFELVAGQPSPGVWGVAACGDWLLVANGSGVFAKELEGGFRQVVSGLEVARLVMVESGLCFAIGMNEIAVLSRCAQGWRECAERVPGFGYPAVVHASKAAAWIEVGANLVGRVSLESGVIKVRVIDSFPWRDPRWIHVSVLGGTVVLSGPESGRVFYDEETLQLREHAPVEEVLQQYQGVWPARIAGDPQGTLWLSHAQGVGLFRRESGGYVDESNLYRIVDRYIPQIQVVPGQGVFLSTGSEIFDVEEPDRSRRGEPERFVPTIVSAVDTASGRLLVPAGGFVNGSVFPYDRNSLTLRLFAGSYSARRAPPYEVRTNGGKWERLDGSTLTLPNLREGSYQVEIRLADKRGPLGRATRIDFSVEPPWTRTWQGYLAYCVVAAIGLGAFARWLGRRARRRNAALEALVGERTEQLQATMRRLEEETRNSATLAERNRLAGEIHDTLEQSLSALSLQLASAARLPECTESVRAGLAIARNMVAFSKDEVRNAVMDLHSPQIEAEGILGALERLVGQSLPGEIQGTVKAEGVTRVLGSKIEHHLLRIAQEAVANTVKHAEARHIDVHLRYLDEEVVLAIVDDGKGFDPIAARQLPPGHFGLKLLRGRAAKLGGKMEIASGPQQGTRIEIHVPTDR